MDKRTFILHEAEQWKEEGIINEQQLEQITSRYPHKQKASSLPILAAILIGLGVLTFIASNWQELSNFVRLAIIFISLILSYCGGEFARTKGYEKVGTALTAVGVVIYGAGFILVGQMYHLSANPVNAFYLWFIGAALLAYHYRSQVLTTLSLLILFVSAVYGADDGNRDLMATTIYYILYFVGLAPLVWRFRAPWLVVPSLLFLMGFAAYDLRNWGEGLVYPTLFTLFLLAAQLMPKSAKVISQSMRTLSYLAQTFFAVILIFFHDEFRMVPNQADMILWIVTLLMAAGYGFLCYRAKKNEQILDVIPIAAFLLLYLPGVRFFIDEEVSVLIIVALFLFSVGMVWGGERLRSIARINLGAILFGVICFVGYVNFAWDFMDKSLFFLVGGVLLLVISFFIERQRRKWVHEARRDEL